MKKGHPDNDISNISRLFLIRFKGKLNGQDEETLKSWSTRTKRNQQIYKLLTDPDELQREYTLQRLIDTAKAEQEMKSRLSDIPKSADRRLRLIRAVIAIAILAIPIIWFSTRPAYNNTNLPTGRPQTMTSIDRSEIKPGSTKAIVTTPSGKSIALDGTDASGAALTALLESDTEKNPLPGMTREEQLCIDVPRGGEFKIVLEDSTTVWLNSESSLRYPETFSPTNRYVEIHGEAYFEVKSDAENPFIVNTDGLCIKVYGTCFNLRNYDEDNNIYTTLENGCLKLSRTDSPTTEVVLSPNQQAVFNRCDSSLTMRPVNTHVITGWREGRFVFEGQSLLNIMHDLARWYNFKFEFDDDSIADIVFNGSIPRYADFKTAIRILENCGGISFHIHDSTVTISAVPTIESNR